MKKLCLFSNTHLPCWKLIKIWHYQFLHLEFVYIEILLLLYSAAPDWNRQSSLKKKKPSLCCPFSKKKQHSFFSQKKVPAWFSRTTSQALETVENIVSGEANSPKERTVGMTNWVSVLSVCFRKRIWIFLLFIWINEPSFAQARKNKASKHMCWNDHGESNTRRKSMLFWEPSGHNKLDFSSPAVSSKGFVARTGSRPSPLTPLD